MKRVDRTKIKQTYRESIGEVVECVRSALILGFEVSVKEADYAEGYVVHIYK